MYTSHCHPAQNPPHSKVFLRPRGGGSGARGLEKSWCVRPFPKKIRHFIHMPILGSNKPPRGSSVKEAKQPPLACLASNSPHCHASPPSAHLNFLPTHTPSIYSTPHNTPYTQHPTVKCGASCHKHMVMDEQTWLGEFDESGRPQGRRWRRRLARGRNTPGTSHLGQRQDISSLLCGNSSWQVPRIVPSLSVLS